MQFTKLFPESIATSELSTGKKNIIFKLKRYWGDNSLNDLIKLVGLFGIPGSHLHLAKVDVDSMSSITVMWLCSTAEAKELYEAILESADSLQEKGVLQVFFAEELLLDFTEGM